jgi:large subunit ribosomal protein L15
MKYNELQATANKNKKRVEAGLVSTPFHTVKVIARGELTAKVTLNVQAASASVQEAIKKAGGTFNKTATPVPVSQKAAEKADK